MLLNSGAPILALSNSVTRSLMKTINSKGLSMEPCITPFVERKGVDMLGHLTAEWEPRYRL